MVSRRPLAHFLQRNMARVIGYIYIYISHAPYCRGPSTRPPPVIQYSLAKCARAWYKSPSKHSDANLMVLREHKLAAASLHCTILCTMPMRITPQFAHPKLRILLQAPQLETPSQTDHMYWSMHMPTKILQTPELQHEGNCHPSSSTHALLVIQA